MNEQLGVMKFEDRHKITDFYIPLIPEDDSGSNFVLSEATIEQSYAYTGVPDAKLIFDGTDPNMVRWLMDVYIKSDKEARLKSNFRLEHEGVMFRAHRAQTVNGYELALRALPKEAPSLEALQMDPRLRTLLMSNQLLYGGLVIVAAAFGQGKTTTISATVKSRLKRFAGHCNAVEDPPELPLHGFHGRGRCVQLPVVAPPDALPGTGYAEALVNVRRFFPAMAGGGTMLVIGEVRNAETAAETLLAAFEGHLVLTTFHGSSIPHALMRFLALAGEKLGERSARDLMAATLKLCAHQKLKLHDSREGWERGELSGDFLTVSGAGSRASNAIRDFDVQKVMGCLEEQKTNLAKMSTDPDWLRSNAGQLPLLIDRSDSR